MICFMKCRVVPAAPACCRSLYSNLFCIYSEKHNRIAKKPKHLDHPAYDKFWRIFGEADQNAYKCKMFMLDELISESRVNHNLVPEHIFSKILLVNTNITSLMKKKIVKDSTSVVQGFLSVLESFPFDASKPSAGKQLGNHLTVTQIRDIIEWEYLAWKYKADVKDIKDIFSIYRYSFYIFRSLGNLQRNVNKLDELMKMDDISLTEKIYHLNQKPFQIESVKDFQRTIVGLDWQLLPVYGRKLVFYSHYEILLRVSFLKAWDFTDQQIQEGLPFLHCSYLSFMTRLHFLLNDPDIGKHKNDIKFLVLLCYPRKKIKDLLHLHKASYTELIEAVSTRVRSKTPVFQRSFATSILFHISEFYQISNKCAIILKRHPKYRLSSITEVRGTLEFLKSLEIKDKEFQESITIVFYPKYIIESVLEEIQSNTENLEKYGFQNGCVPEETNFFKWGTKEKQKILQLCLYYLEKPYNFSGDGIWGPNYLTESNISMD